MKEKYSGVEVQAATKASLYNAVNCLEGSFKLALPKNKEKVARNVPPVSFLNLIEKLGEARVRSDVAGI